MKKSLYLSLLMLIGVWGFVTHPAIAAEKLQNQIQVNSVPIVQIISPTPNAIVDIPATDIVIQFLSGSKVELRVNGQLVNPSLIARTESNATTKLIKQTWYGVSLQEGENTISAQVVGSALLPVTIKVIVRGAPKKLKLNTLESQIPADGHSTVTIRGELIDQNGVRSNRNGIVTLVATDGEFVGKNIKPDQPGFHVAVKNGEFTATLRSELKAQTVRIHAVSGDLEAYTQLDFKTALRPSLVTGVIDVRLGARVPLLR